MVKLSYWVYENDGARARVKQNLLVDLVRLKFCSTGLLAGGNNKVQNHANVTHSLPENVVCIHTREPTGRLIFFSDIVTCTCSRHQPRDSLMSVSKFGPRNSVPSMCIFYSKSEITVFKKGECNFSFQLLLLNFLTRIFAVQFFCAISCPIVST